MSRKVCRRKHYALVNPIDMAILGAARAGNDVLDRLRLRNLSSIEAFARGQATPDDWRTVADMVNVAQTMGQGGVGPAALPACASVEVALAESHARYKATGRMGMTGPQLQAMRDLHEYHDLQVQSISRGEFERWVQATANRIRSTHPDLKVFV